MTKDIANIQNSHLEISEKDSYPSMELKIGGGMTKIRTDFGNSQAMFVCEKLGLVGNT